MGDFGATFGAFEAQLGPASQHFSGCFGVVFDIRKNVHQARHYFDNINRVTNPVRQHSTSGNPGLDNIRQTLDNN